MSMCHANVSVNNFLLTQRKILEKPMNAVDTVLSVRMACPCTLQLQVHAQGMKVRQQP